MAEEKIKSIKRTIVKTSAGFLTAGFLFAVSIGFVNAQKIPYGVKIGGLDVGGMRLEEAREEISKMAEEFSLKKITFDINGGKYETTIEDIGARIDIERTLSEANVAGRNGNFLINLGEQLSIMVDGADVGPVVDVDDEKLEAYLRGFKKYEIEKNEASVSFNDSVGDFFVQSSSDGRVIDRDMLKKDIKDRLWQSEEYLVEASFIIDDPMVDDQMAQDALDDVREFFSNHSGINLIYNGNDRWPVDKKTIGTWISINLAGDGTGLVVSWDLERISGYLTTISQNINKEPIDAVLTYKNNIVQAFSLSRDGKYMNVKKSADNILVALDGGNKEARLEMDSVKAKIDTAEIENLGLTSLLATGVSDFAGSPANRVHNIKVGTAKFNGLLIAPGEEFSFVDHLGEVGAKEGYLPELVIKNNKTIPEYGGGVCQVSTTAFRGAMMAGLEIRERHPHSFPVKYYAPQGFDAAIYPPSPDLKFVNDTTSNILIQSKVRGTKVYFEFYGTDYGRKVVLTGPEEYDKKPDGSMKTRLTREIFDKDGNSIKKSVFRSSYKSPDLYPVVRNPLE